MFKKLILASAAASILVLAGGIAPADAQQGHWFYDQYRHYNADDAYRRDTRVRRKFRRRIRNRAQRRQWLKHFRKRHYGAAQPIYPGNGGYIEEDEVVVFRPQRPWRSRQIIEEDGLPPAYDRRARYQPDTFDLDDEEFEPRPARKRAVRRKAVPDTRIRTGYVPKPKAKPRRLTRSAPQEVEVSALNNGSANLESRKPRKAKVRRKVASRSGGPVSCAKARGIVAGFGFTNIEAKSCTGKTYDFSAKRDGKPFEISLLAASGELKQVKRLK